MELMEIYECKGAFQGYAATLKYGGNSNNILANLLNDKKYGGGNYGRSFGIWARYLHK